MQKAENSFWDNFTPFIYRIGIMFSEKMAFLRNGIIFWRVGFVDVILGEK